jgi:hypothetical protein
MNKKHIHYNEGQWFAVPLRKDGYALGIIVRGSYKTKGGLGYFFGPKLERLPEDRDTWEKKPEDAVLITQFGDLGIITGRWPLIHSTRAFVKDKWPVPHFGSIDPLRPGVGHLREYAQDEKGNLVLIRQVVVDAADLVGVPLDRDMGGGAVEIKLTKLLDDM